MNKQVLTKMFSLLCFLTPVISGCHSRETKSDLVLEGLQWYACRLEEQEDQVGAEQRARLAISKWQNGVLDPEPILIDAILGTCRFLGGVERACLILTTFDEDQDLAGFTTEEEQVDPNGVRRTLVEKYPVFAHYSNGTTDQGVNGRWVIPVRVREGKERKPEQHWREYLATSHQRLRDEYTKRLRADFAGTYHAGFWKDTLPPIYVSAPEGDRLDVRLCLYDRGGHLSDHVSPVTRAQREGN
jgi:hypothetical protein